MKTVRRKRKPIPDDDERLSIAMLADGSVAASDVLLIVESLTKCIRSIAEYYHDAPNPVGNITLSGFHYHSGHFSKCTDGICRPVNRLLKQLPFA